MSFGEDVLLSERRSIGNHYQWLERPVLTLASVVLGKGLQNGIEQAGN